MNQGKYVFAQLMSLLNHNEFNRCVKRYNGNYRVRFFTCWHQFLCLSFGQLSQRESLRDTVTCLSSHQNKHFHLGIKNGVKRSTFSEANEKRDYRIFQDFAQYLIQQARDLYKGFDQTDLGIKAPVYAIDATTIDLCISIFWWAPFRKTKAAIKLNTQLDLKCGIPTFIHITDGKQHEVNSLDLIEIEPAAFYVFDKGYLDYRRLYNIKNKGATFVTRPRSNAVFKRLYSAKADKANGIKCDQTVKLVGFEVSKKYPDKIRRVKYYDKELDKTFVFITNNFEIQASEVADLYKNRWQIELFFKWIKQHLRVKTFWGHSKNAVYTQIWVAISSYVLVAILKKKLDIPHSMYEILQILSVSLLDKTPVNELFMKTPLQKTKSHGPNQLNFFGL